MTNFAQKSSKNPRFSSWFKKRAETPYNTRRRLEYEPTPLVTERDRKNPLTYMRLIKQIKLVRLMNIILNFMD